MFGNGHKDTRESIYYFYVLLFITIAIVVIVTYCEWTWILYAIMYRYSYVLDIMSYYSRYTRASINTLFWVMTLYWPSLKLLRIERCHRQSAYSMRYETNTKLGINVFNTNKFVFGSSNRSEDSTMLHIMCDVYDILFNHY